MAIEHARRWAWAILGSMLVAACSSQPPGGLVLEIETDVPLPKDVDTIHLQVSSNGSTQFENSYSVGNGALLVPATLTLLPGSTATAPVTIRLLAYRGTDVRMLREVITTIPTTRVATLLLPIQWLSFGMTTGGSVSDPSGVQSTCRAGETPDEGGCVPSTVDSGSLPAYSASAVFAGGDGTGNGTCYDLLGCFAALESAPLDSSNCTIADPGGADVNVALALPASSGDGECDASRCLVPVPMATKGSGWTRPLGGRIALPTAVCTDHAKGSILEVLTSTKCASATAEVPLCGPWSSVDTGAGTTGGGITQGKGDAGSSGSKDAGDATVHGSSDGGDAAKDATGCPRDVCPVAIAADEAGVHAIAVDSTHMYWGDALGNIVKVGLDGGGVFTLTSGPPTVGAIAVNSHGVYWIAADAIGSGDLWHLLRVGTDGGSPATLASGQYYASLALDPAGNAFVFDITVNTVSVVAADAAITGAAKTLASDQLAGGTGGGDLAVYGANVYWTVGTSNDGGAGAVATVPTQMGNTVTLLGGLSDPEAIAVDQTGIYWVEAMAGSIVEMGLDGGQATTLANNNGNPLAGIAIDDTYVYSLGPGAVIAVRKSGGAKITLATNNALGELIAVSDAGLFWTSGTTTEVINKLSPK